MLILAGLGNPEAKYEKNRHNVGFMAVDALARRWGTGPWRARFQGPPPALFLPPYAVRGANRLYGL